MAAYKFPSLRGCPADIKKIWARTGYEKALYHLVRRGATWEDASDRLLAVGLRRRDALRRYSNLLVRCSVLSAIKDGHAYLVREMGGETYVALDFGAGRCSTSFVRAVSSSI